MRENFQADYARAYDLVYSDKDYEGESKVLQESFRQFANGSTKSILDLGCGTGSHAIELARSGFRVVGVDRSASMLRLAMEKAKSRDVELELLEGDIRDFDLGQQRFDAVVAMFAVLGYLADLEDLCSGLRQARTHLRDGGLLTADVWFGPGVIHQRPETRFRTFQAGDHTVIKASSATLDLMTQSCEVTMEFWITLEERIWSHAREVHTMRFFFADELRLLLSGTGFELVRFSGFPDVTTEPGSDTWSVLFVARAI